MRRQGLKSTRKKPPDTDLEDKCKTNAFFCTTMDPYTTKERVIYSDLCGRFPITSINGNKYIYVMYISFSEGNNYFPGVKPVFTIS